MRFSLVTPGIAIRLKRTAIFIHRWMGVTFCVLFAWWFVSGIFMMYWDYPEVSPGDRLARAPVLDASRIRLTPSEAFARLDTREPVLAAQLASLDGRPVFRFTLPGGDERLVFADDGSAPDEFSPAFLLRSAAAWTGRTAAEAHFDGVLTRADQWTVSGEFVPLRPLWKYSWPDGEEVYVSAVTGRVEQYTTRASRLGAYFGAIPHWLYFTPLRQNGRLWSRIVIGLSGAATLTALFGLLASIWMYAPNRRVPYAGTKRLHVILGLFFGIIACTWSFSGMLSMDPFPIRSAGPGSGARIERALRGRLPSLDSFPAVRQALAASSLRVKDLEFRSFAGRPVYLAVDSPLRTQVIPSVGGPVATFDVHRIQQLIAEAVQPVPVAEFRWLTEYDAYYLDRHRGQPLPVLLVRLNDAEDSRYYVDPRTAEIVGGYSSAAWVTRWLYHGLHSLNFPWLYEHRPAWDLVVLALLAGGSALSITSILIAARLLRRARRSPRA